MELTRERALELHRQMWTDMQKDLGDNPGYGEREKYKNKWCKEHFPNEYIDNDCFLCEYDRLNNGHCNSCRNTCLIKWVNDTCLVGAPEFRYYNMPISRLLTLPERELGKEN